ncbi:hypothetical protein BH23ACT5_BH23ACT5_21910 [soil metagenome]
MVQSQATISSGPAKELSEFSLMGALAGRRARRFGLGMEIPSGPLAFRSRHEPVPLSDAEQAVLVAAATGVSGWNFGVPHGPHQPDEHGSFTLRYTGRTAPTAAGIGTPVLFYTDDNGTYVTNTRDVEPKSMAGTNEVGGDLAQIVDVCREHTTKLSDNRLDVPAAAPHMLEPNTWMANAPGSTLFMPMADASEQYLAMLALFVANGYVMADDRAGRTAGELAPFIRSGLLDEQKPFPLSVLDQVVHESTCAEVSFMAHNVVLAMQAIGLGGLYFNGLNRWSVLGAFADDGIEGLGFTFAHDEEWTVPNPVGLDGIFEGSCPPYHPDMRSAVEAMVHRKFGPGGAYDPSTPGPWNRSDLVKGSVTPHSDEFVDCLTEIAQYTYDTYGRIPGTVQTMILTGFAQAVHIDTEYYDTHFAPGTYLETHANHMQRWHSHTD